MVLSTCLASGGREKQYKFMFFSPSPGGVPPLGAAAHKTGMYPEDFVLGFSLPLSSRIIVVHPQVQCEQINIKVVQQLCPEGV